MIKKITAVILLLSLLLFSGCSKAAPEISVTETIDGIYNELLDPYGENWLAPFDTEQIFRKFGISSSLYREQRVYASEKSSRGSAIAGFEAEEGKFSELVKALENAKEKAKSDFHGYLPDQYKITEEASIVQAEPYCFLVMTDRNEKVLRSLDEILAGES